MSKAKTKVADRTSDEIAKDVIGDAKAMGEVFKNKEPAEQIKEFAVQGRMKNNDQKHKPGTQMLLWAAVTSFLFSSASKPADSPDDPLKMHLDGEAPPNSGGSSLMGVFTLLKKLVSKKPEPVSEDEFQTTLDGAGANGDSSSILENIYNGIRALRQRNSELQKDKNELTAKLVDAGKDLARETARANTAGVQNADFKEENEKLKTQLRNAKKRSKASPAGSAQDTLSEDEFQRSGCATFIRGWLINELPVSWATTDKRNAIMFNGELTAMSPMRAVLELLPGVVDKIMANLKSFLEINPIEKKNIESTDPKMKPGAYAKLLNMIKYSKIAKEPIFALIKAICTAKQGAEVTPEQVGTICTERLLDISDMCVTPMTTADENGTDQYFPTVTRFQLIESHAELSGPEGVIEAAKLYVNDSWQLRSDPTFLDNLVKEKKIKSDARKAEKALKKAKLADGGAVTTNVIEEVPITETLIGALNGANDEEAVAVQLLGMVKHQNDKSPEGEDAPPTKKSKSA